MSSASQTDPTARVSGIRIGYALFGGILAWMAHLIGQAGLNGWVCRSGQLWPMHALTGFTLVVTLHALWVARRIARDQRDVASVQAAQFLGFAGVAINVFNAGLIVAEWIPVVTLHPCAVG